MSVRPPTLREKRRYLLARIDPSGTNPEAKDLYYAVYEAVVSLFGDMSAAAMQPSVIAVEGEHALLRCRRGAEREFVIALSTLTTCRDAGGSPGPCDLRDNREPAGTGNGNSGTGPEKGGCCPVHSPV